MIIKGKRIDRQQIYGNRTSGSLAGGTTNQDQMSARSHTEAANLTSTGYFRQRSTTYDVLPVVRNTSPQKVSENTSQQAKNLAYS